MSAAGASLVLRVSLSCRLFYDDTGEEQDRGDGSADQHLDKHHDDEDSDSSEGNSVEPSMRGRQRDGATATAMGLDEKNFVSRKRTQHQVTVAETTIDLTTADLGLFQTYDQWFDHRQYAVFALLCSAVL